MSMISAQIDELRELATRYDELQVGAVKAVTMPPNMGSILRDAADTIWQLRDDLQRANAENAKLRELVTRMASALGIYSEWVDANWCKSSCRLEFECLPEDMDIRCPAWAAMRELGVEVD